MSHDGTARVRHFQPRVIISECRINDCASSVLSYDQPLVLNMIFSKLLTSINVLQLRSPGGTVTYNVCI